MKEAKNKLTELDTYVFIDVSNIRAACVRTLGFNIDFYKFLDYLRRKYPNLKNVYYYEGIARNDSEKQAEFDKLRDTGYDVRSLERKAYTEPPVYREVKCRSCKTKRRVQVLKRTTKLKSNVDVYLATDLLKLAYLITRPVRILLAACDGDYAEMIKSALETNSNVRIEVLATPVVPRILKADGTYEDKNTCSTRLQKLRRKLQNFAMLDIGTIQDLIKQK